MLTEKFADFSGHLDRQPGVSLVNAEARSYINHSSERYDLVQISLIDTWAATVAGGLTLTENRLYTVEAWDDFYRALKPGGLLSVSRWYGAEKHRGELYRLIAIAASALQRKGVSAGELRHHVVAVNVGNIVTVITRLTRSATQNGKARARDFRRRASRYCWGRTSPSMPSPRHCCPTRQTRLSSICCRKTSLLRRTTIRSSIRRASAIS